MSCRQHVRLFLGQGWVLLTLASLISIDLWYWSRTPRHSPLLLCVCAPCIPFMPIGRGYHPVYPHALVVSELDVWRIVGRYDDEAERVRSNPRAGEAIVATVGSFPHSETVGLLAPVVRTHDHTMSVGSEGDPLSASDLAAIRSLYAAWLGSKWDWAGPWNQEHAKLLAQGDGTTRQVLWGGVVHDFLGLAATVAFVCSLRLWIGSLRDNRHMKRQLLIQAGLCPRCRNGIAGLPAEAVCPECGENLGSGC